MSAEPESYLSFTLGTAFDLLFRGKPFPVDLAAYREFKR